MKIQMRMRKEKKEWMKEELMNIKASERIDVQTHIQMNEERQTFKHRHTETNTDG